MDNGLKFRHFRYNINFVLDKLLVDFVGLILTCTTLYQLSYRANNANII